jgi:pentatricopeptide repeat protein
MDVFFIEFRDPLFGIIVFFVLVFVIAFFSYWWGRFKTKEDHRRLDRFIKDFHQLPPEKELQQLIQNSPMSTKSWMLLAHAYIQNGDFEKAIEIYQAIVEKQDDAAERNDTLFLLGKTYFRAGFLERSKALFLQILKHAPRTTQALRYLLLVYEQLHQYENALEVLDPLDELNSDTRLDRLYLECISVINDPDMESIDKANQLLKIYQSHHLLTYLIFEYLFKHQHRLAWLYLDQSEVKRIADILWQLPEAHCDLGIIAQNSYLRELFTARGITKLAHHSDQFELDMLIKLDSVEQKGATLTFEYLCRSCKHILPFPFHRCPNCYAIDSVMSQPVLTKDHFEANLSFQ